MRLPGRLLSQRTKETSLAARCFRSHPSAREASKPDHMTPFSRAYSVRVPLLAPTEDSHVFDSFSSLLKLLPYWINGMGTACLRPGQEFLTREGLLKTAYTQAGIWVLIIYELQAN